MFSVAPLLLKQSSPERLARLTGAVFRSPCIVMQATDNMAQTAGNSNNDTYAVPPDFVALIDEMLLLPELDEPSAPSTPVRTRASFYGANPPAESYEYSVIPKAAEAKNITQPNGSPAAITTTTPQPLVDPANKKPKRRMTHQQRALLAALCALNFCGYMCYANIAPFFPQEVIRKGGSATWTGLIFACYQLVMFVMAPIIGRYIEVVGARFMLLAGPFIAAWCAILFGFLDLVPHGPTFLALAFLIRMFEALGSIMFVTVSMSIRPALFPNDIAFVYGILQTFTSIGLAVGPALGGFLYEYGGYGLPFWVMGGLFMVLDVILYFILPDFGQNAPASTDKQINAWHFLKEFDILLDLLTYSIVAFAAMFYDATISFHILPLVGHNTAHVGFVMFAVGAAECFAAPLGGIYQDRGGSSRLVIIFGYIIVLASLTVMGPTPLLPFLHTSLFLVIVGTCFYGIGLGCFFAAPYKEAVEATIRKGYPPTQRTFGVLAGCFQSFFSFGAFIGPAVGGFLQDHIGFRWSSTIVAGVVLLLFLTVLGHTASRSMHRRNEQKSLMIAQKTIVEQRA